MDADVKTLNIAYLYLRRISSIHAIKGLTMSSSAVRECENGLKNELVVKMPRKTAAQYSREYRARKKARKLAFLPKPTPKTPTERSREFRARKKALENAAKGHSMTSSILDEQQQNTSLENIELQKPKKKSKTPAERTRECRARKRALQNALLERLLPSSSNIDQPDVDQQNNTINIAPNSIGRSKIMKKKPKTPTERSRECRARKRALKKAMIEHLTITPSTIILQDDLHQQNAMSENFAQLHPQCTLSENIANLLPQNIQSEDLADLQQKNFSSENITAKSKNVDSVRTFKEKSKTPKERSREFRARQKALENAVKHLPSNVLLDNDICVTFGP